MRGRLDLVDGVLVGAGAGGLPLADRRSSTSQRSWFSSVLHFIISAS